MKRTIKVVALCLAGICLVLGIGIWYMASHGFSFSVGRYLAADNAGHLLILENSPISMGNRTKDEHLFSDLSSGDEILVLHDGIAESYPGQTGVYFCLRLKDGSIEDISENVLAGLRELDWLYEE